MSDMIHLMYNGVIEQSASPTELYTKPATKFVASFIGHYNVLTAEQMKTVSGQSPESETVAFRPEIIAASKEPIEKENAYMMKGRIAVSLPHGNIIRYAVMCGGVQVDVDELFSDKEPFQTGDEIYLAVDKGECIYL